MQLCGSGLGLSRTPDICSQNWFLTFCSTNRSIDTRPTAYVFHHTGLIKKFLYTNGTSSIGQGCRSACGTPGLVRDPEVTLSSVLFFERFLLLYAVLKTPQHPALQDYQISRSSEDAGLYLVQLPALGACACRSRGQIKTRT